MKKTIGYKVCENLCLFLFGGFTYGFLEILWRRRTHISMVITGGLCLVLLYHIFKKFKDKTLLIKCIIGSALITTLEFLCGCIVNLWLKLKVWDYSNLKFNLLGQICVLYSVLWGFLTIPISFVCSKVSNLKLRRFSKQKQKESCCS